MTNNIKKFRPVALVAIAGFGLAVATSSSVAPTWLADMAPVSSVLADDGPKGQGGPTGEHGFRGSKGPTEVGGKGQGQGGPSGDSDAKGPRYGGDGSKPMPGTQGGKPVWAQEGIGDVELGRLNVVRAPAHVIDRALAEALATLQPGFYNKIMVIADNPATSLEQKLALLAQLAKDSFSDTTLARIDSPLQNLGLYKDLMTDRIVSAAKGNYDTSSSATRALLLAAAFIGSASDKTIAVSTATVEAINKIMALTLPSGMSAADVAAAAEIVRKAIAQAHG